MIEARILKKPDTQTSPLRLYADFGIGPGKHVRANVISEF